MRNLKFNSKIVILFIICIIFATPYICQASSNELDYSKEYLNELIEKNKEIAKDMNLKILNNKFLLSLPNKNGEIRYISANGESWESVNLGFQDITYGMNEYFAIDKDGGIFNSKDLIKWSLFTRLKIDENIELLPLDISVGDGKIIVSHYSPMRGMKNYKNGLSVLDINQMIWKQTTGYNKEFGTTLDILYIDKEFILAYENDYSFLTPTSFYTSKDGIHWILVENKVDLIRKLNKFVNQDTNTFTIIDILKNQISENALNGQNIPIQVFLDDILIEFDQEALLIAGRVLVPVRKIFETLDGTVSWNQKEQSVNGEINGNKICLVVGEKKATVNGKSIMLDVPAQIISNRVLVPVRFIADSIGKKSNWDQNNYMVRLSSKE